MYERIDADVLVIGSGLAGLAAALLASRHGRVVLVTKGRLGVGNSRLAQGGLAAALAEDDSPAFHAADTLRAGQGLCDPQAVQTLVARGPGVVRLLAELGVPFDVDAQGNLLLGREGAHTRRRIVHAGGDATGCALVDALCVRVRAHDRIAVREGVRVAELLVSDGECTGAVATTAGGGALQLTARAVVLATGGLGQLYRYTTNAPVALGEGYALAYRAGAVLRDMEFVQFHPTALGAAASPLPLVSEAVRGEGGVLVNSCGERFLRRVHPLGELAARDVVARAIYQELRAGRKVFLDARYVPDLAGRFPTVVELCRRHGVDPLSEPIPVVPAAHFCMGGVLTDPCGRTTVRRLYAVGEVASSGLHGANRLASNALLEGVAMAEQLAEALPEALDEPVQRVAPPLPAAAVAALPMQPDPRLLAHLQDLMWAHVGIVRDEDGLARAERALAACLERLDPLPTPDRHLVTTALLVARAARWRRESRGAHYRQDAPHPDPAFHIHSLQGGAYASVVGTTAHRAGLA